MAEIENLKIGANGTIHIVGNENIITEEWEASKTYVKDKSYVIREHKLYVCNVTHTSTSSFDPTKWTEITVIGAIDNALDMTAEASGAIATFDTSLALPLQDCTIAINAVQESGTPTPSSPKAISGFTGANIKVAGKNLINITDCLNDYYVKSSDLSVSSIAGANVFYCDVPKNTDLVLTPDKSNRCVIMGYKNRPSTIAGSIGDELIVDSASGITSCSFNTGNNQFLAIYVNRDSANKPTQIMLEVGTVASAYQAYNSTTTAITWQDEAGTVYGGSLDVTSGVLTVTHKFITFDFTSSADIGGGYRRKSYNLGADKAVYPPTASNPQICNVAPYMASYADKSTHFYCGADNCNIILPSDTPTSTTIEIVYELLNPTTYQLTPTQISAIVGTNNVFTDTNGDTTLEYYTKRGEQTVRIAEGVAVDVINNKNIDNLTTTNKTLVGAVNEVVTGLGTKAKITRKKYSVTLTANSYIAPFTYFARLDVGSDTILYGSPIGAWANNAGVTPHIENSNSVDFLGGSAITCDVYVFFASNVDVIS